MLKGLIGASYRREAVVLFEQIMLQCVRQLLAQSGLCVTAIESPLLGVKRTLTNRQPTSIYSIYECTP